MQYLKRLIVLLSLKNPLKLLIFILAQSLEKHLSERMEIADIDLIDFEMVKAESMHLDYYKCLFLDL